MLLALAQKILILGQQIVHNRDRKQEIATKVADFVLDITFLMQSFTLKRLCQAKHYGKLPGQMPIGRHFFVRVLDITLGRVSTMYATFSDCSDGIESKRARSSLGCRHPMEPEAEYYVECLTSVSTPRNSLTALLYITGDYP